MNNLPKNTITQKPHNLIRQNPLTEEGEELTRLLSFDSSPVVTPTALVAAFSWLMAKTKALYQDTKRPTEQKWYRPSELAKIFGCKRAQMFL